MWIGVLWAGLRVAMWITHVGSKCRHGLLEKSLKQGTFGFVFRVCFPMSFLGMPSGPFQLNQMSLARRHVPTRLASN